MPGVRGKPRSSFVRCAGALAAALGAAASAQPRESRELPDTRPPLQELVQRLDDKLFTVRERATAELAARPDLSLDQAEAMLRDPELTAEQRLRLARAALAIYLRGPRAAMGIRFTSGDDSQPARVAQPQQGFDAADVLQADDVIIEADGQPILHQGALRALILSRSPGDVLPMTVLRAGERERVEVRLGSFEDLSGGAPPQSALLEGWRLRRERLDAPEPAIVPEPAARAEAMPERDSPEWRAVYASADSPGSLVIGGQARQSAAPSLADLQAAELERLRLSGNAIANPRELEQQLQWFQARRAGLAENLLTLEARAQRADISRLERQSLVRDITTLRNSLVATDQQIAALEGAIRASQPRR